AEGRMDEARDVLRRAVRRLSVKRLRSTDWSPCSMLAVAAFGDEDDIAPAREPIANWFAPYGSAFAHLFDAFVAARFNQHDRAVESAGTAARELRAWG